MKTTCLSFFLSFFLFSHEILSPVQKELMHCAVRIFRFQTSLFSCTPPPHFIVVAAAKSIGQSNILNIEKGEGESIGCNAISLKTRGKAQIIVSQQFCTELLVIPDLLFELDSSHSSCLSDPHLDYMYSSWFPIRFSQIDWDKSIISFRICICMDLKPLSHSS